MRRVLKCLITASSRVGKARTSTVPLTGPSLSPYFLSRSWLSSNPSPQPPRDGQVPYIIRPMLADDISKLHALLAENQWNMEQDYLSCVFSTDPSGLLVVVDADGNIIGHNGILSHGDYLASSGMNIVREGYRQLGIGRALFTRVMEVMRDRNVGGTALSNRITFYEQFGWTIPSFTLEYNQGKVSPTFVQSPATGDFEVTATSDVSFDDLVNYDAGLHTVPRHRYLYNWINHSRAHSFVALRHGRIVGYCVLRPADAGWKMYPLFADDKNIAHALFCKAAAMIPEGEDVIFTQPIENKQATEFVKGNNLTTYLSMTRLYNKWPVHVDIGRVYSVSSTEYGII